uniref:Uncharacterized protein n=1 Tax=Cacopsylla melanoneura TaxID=428564 RepID=A0A8D8ZV44_9HEMI
MSLVPWKDGKCVVWDATCGDTVAPSHVEGSARQAGRVAEVRATQKKNKYKHIGEDHMFVPFSVETLGPWCEEAKRFVKEVGRRLVDCTGERRAAAFFSERISLSIQRGNAAAVMGTVAGGSRLEEVFFFFFFFRGVSPFPVAPPLLFFFLFSSFL